jgi:predicted CXXCH cytochrome family protein
LQEPLAVSARFYEWQLSRHQAKDVTCEKCHGGDPAASARDKAHAGVRPSADSQSRLHYKKQPETCGSCHQAIVNAFVQSRHYQNLRGVGLGASCNTCHAHMATQVVVAPRETANLCARCHDTLNFVQPRPQIPAQAAETMTALQRANSVVLWAQLLLAQVEQRGLPRAEESAALQAAQQRLNEAKAHWHTFELAATRGQADAAFQQGVRARDALRKKLSIR